MTTLHAHYAPAVRVLATKQYFLHRYCFEQLLGLPFHRISLDDVRAQASLYLAEVLAQPPPSTQTVCGRLHRGVPNSIDVQVAREHGVGPGQVKGARESLAAVFARPAGGLKLDREEVLRALGDLGKDADKARARYLYALEEGEGFVEEGDLLAHPDPAPDPSIALYRREQTEALQRKLASLDDSPRGNRISHADAVRMYFGVDGQEELNLEQMSRQVGYSTREMPRKIVQLALRRLSHPSRGLQAVRDPEDAPTSLWNDPSKFGMPTPLRSRNADDAPGYGGLEVPAAERVDTPGLRQWVDDTLSQEERRLLPLLLQGQRPEGEDSRRWPALSGKMRLWFTTGGLEQYGPLEAVRETLVRLCGAPDASLL